MIFCKIDNELIRIIKKVCKNRVIIDCGCGDGLLGSILKDVISIDIYKRDSVLIDNIIVMDVCDFPINKYFFPVFLRPCHGRNFVNKFLEKNKGNCINCMYVSHPSNLDNDIDTDKFTVTQIEDWEGQDGERVFIVSMNDNLESSESFEMEHEKTKFVRLVEDYVSEKERDNRAFWRKEEDGKWINFVGGWCFPNSYLIVLETVYADRFEDLDWSKTYLNNPNSDSGWLSPDGIFYGCPSESHDSCAYYLLKSTIGELEKKGYIRIMYKHDWHCEGELTEAQAKWLLEKGFVSPDSYKIKRAIKTFGIGKSWTKAYKYFHKDGD